MKRIPAVTLVLLSLMLHTAFAQSGRFHEASSELYAVYSEVGSSHAQETATMMDAVSSLYNRYFRFDVDSLETRLRIRIFANKTNFDNYLRSIISQGRDSFVYLQYSDLGKSELVGFYTDEASFRESLVHHGAIQFLKAFVPNPPLWMQKGFAVYFEKSTYDAETQTAGFEENLTWLRTLKSIVNMNPEASFIDLETLLTIDVETANANIESFYAESWGLITFTVNTSIRNYNRLLWDSLSSLDPRGDIQMNEQAILSGPFSWITTHELYADFERYILEVKTFPELVRDGMTAYGDGDFDEAEKSFLRAIERNPKHHIPYYYLGLINYGRNDFSLAEYYYLTAQQMGGEPGLTYYALGVNAYADNRLEDAVDYLTQAKQIDPASFGEKSEALLNRLPG